MFYHLSDRRPPCQMIGGHVGLGERMRVVRIDDTNSTGDGVQAVAVALQVLEHLAVQRNDAGVTAIAAAIGVSKSRAHRYLRTLLDHGYVVQTAGSDKYRVGARLVTLGRAVAENFDLASVARPIMRELRDLLGHPVVVSQVDPAGTRVVATLLGTAPIEISVREGAVLSFHGSSQGKVVLAWGDNSTRNRVLGSRLDMFTPGTIVSPTALRAELDAIKARGWAVSPNETLAGVNALAAPLFDGSGACVGAIAIVDSVQHLEPVPAPEQVRQVTAAAERISQVLGHAGPAALQAIN